MLFFTIDIIRELYFLTQYMEASNWMNTITSTTDAYSGLHLSLKEQPPAQEFAAYLTELEGTRKYKTIWVELTTQHLGILDICTNKLGYKIHTGLDKTITIYKWLIKRSDLVVPYSVFWVAAGALLIHENKVLLVQEKGGARKGYYGLPGGRADRGELISHCAERELFEETGIRAKFQRVILFRELTQRQIYGCVDIYFVCLVKLEEGGLDGFKLCEREISDFAWVPLEEIEEFCAKKSMGTQLEMSKQVGRLYRQKRLFSNYQYDYSLDQVKNSCFHRL